MNSHVKDIKFLIQNIAFGEVNLLKKEENLYKILNSQISFLCKSVPAHMQNQAMFFMLSYSNIRIGEPLNFFKNFYKPVWTVIPHISETKVMRRELTEQECRYAILGQAMALFLHSIDDHLTDGQIIPSHLHLLLRSQAWLLFNNAITEFADGKDETDLANLLINEYYQGMYPDKEPRTLDEYCNRFKKEISTWYIIPMLSAKKITGDPDFVRDIKKAMESFGIAWRLLDDIQDAEEDMASGSHTAVYHSLSDEAKKLWDRKAASNVKGNTDAFLREEIFGELSRGSILDNLVMRIVRELSGARQTAEAVGLHGLGEQYNALGVPIKKILDGR